MSIMRKSYRCGTVVVGLVLTSTAAVLAQTPQATTATYDNWTVRCDMTSTSKNCEIAQSAQVQGQAVSQIAIGRPSKTDPLRIVIQVPINVWLPAGVQLVTDKDPDLVSATFKRCLGGGCFADADLKDDVVKKLRSQTENGRLSFKDAAQKDVALPVSFKGFAAAFDAATKQMLEK